MESPLTLANQTLPNTMDDSAPVAASPAIPLLPLDSVLAIISSLPRWRILSELIKGEPLPVYEIADRLRATPTGISKHCGILLECGVIHRGYGCLFSIDPRFVVPGSRSLDFGFAVIRLDRIR